MILILSERPTLNSSSSIRANTQIMSMCVILLIIVIVSGTPTCLPFRYIPVRNQFRYMFTLSILNIHSSTYQNKLYIMISPKLKWKPNRFFLRIWWMKGISIGVFFKYCYANLLNVPMNIIVYFVCYLFHFISSTFFIQTYNVTESKHVVLPNFTRIYIL